MTLIISIITFNATSGGTITQIKGTRKDVSMQKMAYLTSNANVIRKITGTMHEKVRTK